MNLQHGSSSFLLSIVDILLRVIVIVNIDFSFLEDFLFIDIIKKKNGCNKGGKKGERIVRAPEAYRWSSIHAYYEGMEQPLKLIETGFILGMIHCEQNKAVEGLKDFMRQENDDQCLDDEVKKRKSDGEVKDEIEAMMKGRKLANCQEWKRRSAMKY